MGIGAYRLWPYLSYDLYPLATNPRNIRYPTLLHRGVYAPNLPVSYLPNKEGRSLARC